MERQRTPFCTSGRRLENADYPEKFVEAVLRGNPANHALGYPPYEARGTYPSTFASGSSLDWCGTSAVLLSAFL